MAKWSAGPELNRLVAQHVFGFEVQVGADYNTGGDLVRTGTAERTVVMPLPDYSRRIEMAWLITAKMQEKRTPLRGHNSPPSAEFASWWHGAPLYLRSGEEAALEISVTALTILGIRPEEKREVQQ